MRLPAPVQMGLRLVLGISFLWAGGDKLLNADEFAPLLVSYKLLPLPLVNLVVFWLPVCEILIAVCLLSGLWLRPASLLFSGLMALFVLGIAQALARGIQLHCGCFSTELSGPPRTWLSLWEEALLLIGGLLLWSSLWRSRAAQPPGTGQRVSESADPNVGAEL